MGKKPNGECQFRRCPVRVGMNPVIRSEMVQVKVPDGRPLAHAPVVCVCPAVQGILAGTAIKGGFDRMQTDVNGRFRLPWTGTNYAVVIANEAGFGLAESRDFFRNFTGRDCFRNFTMVVRPWGRIDGVRLNCGQPVAGQRLLYRLMWRSLGSEELRDMLALHGNKTVTDAKGRFSFDHVPPVQLILSGMHKHPERMLTPLQYAEIKPGQTNKIQIETQGRTVIGRMEVEAGLTSQIDFTSLGGWLQPDVNVGKVMSRPSIPKEFDTLESRGKWWSDWHNSEAGRQFHEAFSRSYLIEFHADGSFVADLVEPGKYWMRGGIEGEGRTMTRALTMCRWSTRMCGGIESAGRTIAKINEPIEIPPPNGNAGEAPFDLGRRMLRAGVNLKVGDPAPDFSVQTLDGKALKLSDLRGKYVLLAFWATWCGGCVAETPNLKDTDAAFKDDARFIMVGLNLDAEAAAPRDYARKNQMGWIQGFLGEWSRTEIPNYFGVEGIPSILLIGPDGKVLAKDLRGPSIKSAVLSALSQPGQGTITK